MLCFITKANRRWITASASASFRALVASGTTACSAPEAAKSDLDLCSAKDDSDSCTLACIGVALAGNEPSCGAALTVCKAGGVGIGTIFGDSQ